MAEPQKKLELAIGDVIADRYRIDGVVGRGGFGAVYQATQLDTGLGVALKVLLKSFSMGKKDSKRFQREAALVWWAPWDEASAPAQPDDWRLAGVVASAPAPAPMGWGALLATCRFC